MRANDASAALRALIAEIPVERLRTLLLECVVNGLAPAAPAAAGAEDVAARKRERSRRWAARKRRAAREAKAAAPKRAGRPKRAADKAPSSGNGQGEVTGEVLWRHAQVLEPTRPWLALARELGVKVTAAQASHRNQALPPNLSPAAVARFLTL